MLKTTEEAAKAWCPYTTVGISVGSVAKVASRHDDAGLRIAPGSRCLGPQCMAWRWAQHDEQRGYCGRVGDPQTLFIAQ